MITDIHAKHLREMIEKGSVSLTDEDALTAIELYPAWAVGVAYKVGERIRYEDKLYRVIQAHTSQADWTPDVAVSLFVEVSVEEIPVWKQPVGAQDAYMIGDKVHYPDKAGPVYVSTVDNNVWAPDVYGWAEE